jgi:DNA polymerase III gamma/tau subunit
MVGKIKIMTRKVSIVSAAAIFLLLGMLPAHAGDVIDRVVATVNGHIILQSDWEDAVRYEAFMGGRSLDRISAEEKKAALDRLIDQELLHQQMRASDPQDSADEEEIAKRIQEIRKQYDGAETDQGWQAVLARYQLTQNELKHRIGLQVDVMRLVALRLRPTVNIDAKTVESYYNQELLPQLRQSGAKEIPLAEVAPKIKELLTEKKVNQLLVAWLQNLRAESQIHTGPVAPSPGGQVQ